MAVHQQLGYRNSQKLLKWLRLFIRQVKIYKIKGTARSRSAEQKVSIQLFRPLFYRNGYRPQHALTDLTPTYLK